MTVMTAIFNEKAKLQRWLEVEKTLAQVEALKKLSVNNLTNLTPAPFYVFLNYSHPPLFERIQNIRHYESGRHEERVPAAPT